ncbi:MAG: Type 1 glutamine amidotransferase-like domain-containing protein [Tissierellaceae bacterium]|nr:Type 1 glutamine amidotransferase-like domain-containing protein [Tissierellaceae bacterium]
MSKIKKDELVVFIPSATTKSQEEYYNFFKQNMSEFGLVNIQYVDLYEDWQKVRQARVVYIAGGNTYKLMDIIRKSGFGDFLKQERDKLIIVGNSAGAVVLGKDIRTTNDEDIIGTEDTNGVGLVEYSICPHYTDEKNVRLVNLSKILRHRIEGIAEKSGVAIDDNFTKVIGFTKEFDF